MIRKWELSLIIALVFSMLLSCISFGETCEQVRSDVLRLHILANSDSAADQQLKLTVRDEILAQTEDLFSSNYSIDEAIEHAQRNTQRIQKIAEGVIGESGYNYSVSVKIEKEYFETRSYETVTLPAGEYYAVRVLIGSAQGHNWWCVMYPSMCIPAASCEQEAENVLDKDEYEIVSNEQKYEIRFKAVEWFEQIKQAFYSWF